MWSWLLYIPAGLIEIHPKMKYQLATINRAWDSTLDKNLNLVYGCTHRWMDGHADIRPSIRPCVQTSRALYAPAGWGRGAIKIILFHKCLLSWMCEAVDEPTENHVQTIKPCSTMGFTCCLNMVLLLIKILIKSLRMPWNKHFVLTFISVKTIPFFKDWCHDILTSILTVCMYLHYCQIIGFYLPWPKG